MIGENAREETVYDAALDHANANLNTGGGGGSYHNSQRTAFRVFCFGALCVCGVVEALAAAVTLNAVKKDWVPTLFFESSGSNSKTAVNNVMSRIDLLSEILAVSYTHLTLPTTPYV